MRCTTQAWTWVFGNTAPIASGKPFSPSATAIRISSMPRSLSSFMTRSQNLAPSVCSIQRPSTSLAPSARTPRATWPALLRTVPSSLTLTRSASRKTSGFGALPRRRLERPVLPLGHLVQHRVGDGADQVGRDLDAVELAQVALDLAGAHPPRVHGHDLVAEAGEAALVLGDQLRVEGRQPVARALHIADR